MYLSPTPSRLESKTRTFRVRDYRSQSPSRYSSTGVPVIDRHTGLHSESDRISPERGFVSDSSPVPTFAK